MIAFISPAMGFVDAPTSTQAPRYLNKTLRIVETLRELSVPDLQKLLKCSDALTEIAYMRYQNFESSDTLQAASTFDGAAYKALNAASLSETEFDYLEEHTRILSGLYGVLRPKDGISPYRLEMKTKLSLDGYKNLPEFWGDSLYTELTQHSNGTIINLASKEYAACIEKYLQDELYITCTFKVERQAGLKVCSIAAKQGRGALARWCATEHIDTVEDLKDFHELDFMYIPELSSTTSNHQELVFVKKTIV